MTEPGNLNQLVPKGQDWIPRELADLRRLIRRNAGGAHNASGGGGSVGVISAVRFTSTDSAVPLNDATMDYDQFSNGASYFTYDSPIDIVLTEPGWYQTSFSVSLHGMTAGDSGDVEIDSPGPEIYLNSTFVANPSGFAAAYVSTMPFYVDFPGASVTYRIRLPSGSVVQSDAYLLKLDLTPSSGSGPVATGQYTAPTPPTFGAGFDCSDLGYFNGPITDYVSFDFQTELLQVGWYQATVSATVSGATSGDLLGLDVTMGPGTEDTLTSWATANGSTVVDLTVSTPIFYASADDFSFSAACINAHLNNHGSGSGTISSARLTIVAF